MKRWNPRREPSKKEQLLLKRLKRTRKLFAFFRLHRHEIFDESFQMELEQIYRGTGAGKEPNPPAMMCMVLLLQGYMGISDAEAVEMTIVDARWQMVLDCLQAEEPLFSQGALQAFRERLIASEMDRRLLERTREVAKRTEEFDFKKLPKQLSIAVDSRPLMGAGKVEDTFNLLGHAARKIVQSAKRITGLSYEQICREAGIPLLLHKSIKAALDINWNDPEQKDEAIERLVSQVSNLHDWLESTRIADEEPLRPYIRAVAQVQQQDLESGADGRVKLRQGVARDRRVSIEDGEMRHGRKSRSKRFDGYKEHIAADLDSGLIIACGLTAANRPEDEVTAQLVEDMKYQKIRIGELSVDRAYINSELAQDVLEEGGDILCKPWSGRNSHAEYFRKTDFSIDMRSKVITCPAGHAEYFEPGQVVEFDPEDCAACKLRGQCTHSMSGRGRMVQISRDEKLQHRLRKLQTTRNGRERLRKRTGIEHRLAHIAARKGPKARYKGIRKNLFDLRRSAAIQNFETIHRRILAKIAMNAERAKAA
jgi:hypothetical protein